MDEPAAPGAAGPARPGREAAIAGFLTAAGWGGAARAALAGDASARRYERLRRGAARAVLMDAPAEEDPGRFLRIAAHLRGLGLSAPEVLAADPGAGLLLLEDLGDALFGAAADPWPPYLAAADLLAALHRHPPPAGLPAYDAARAGAQAALPCESYAPGPGEELAAAVQEAVDRLAPGTPVLMLRDFHAGNLIWLPERTGVARVGLLDFQDAMAGHPAYDLVSLTEDARRDLPEGLKRAVTERYLAATGADAGAFAAAAAALGAVRHLRILGVFARLARQGRPGYLPHMPRVWGQLQASLAHPGLGDLRALVAAHLPAPTAERLAALA